MSANHVILGTGAIGRSVAEQLVLRGESARMVNRSGKMEEAPAKDILDGFIEALVEIQHEAESDADMLHGAPYTMPVRRLDDVLAAKQLDLAWSQKSHQE